MNALLKVDPRDVVLNSATPMLMAPRFGRLPPLSSGLHRFVAGADGIYVQARTEVLSLTLRVAALELPYGSLVSSVTYPFGPLPYRLLDESRRRAVACAPTEWAGAIIYRPETGYTLIEPPVLDASAGHIRYDQRALDDAWLLVDLHSHGHGKAYFSATDDASDRGGLYLACVLGNCRDNESVSWATRIVCRQYFFDVAWNPWSEGDDG